MEHAVLDDDDDDAGCEWWRALTTGTDDEPTLNAFDECKALPTRSKALQ
jgi:hypothetical protein